MTNHDQDGWRGRAGAGFTAADAASIAAFLAALRAASFASCLAARSFATRSGTASWAFCARFARDD
jgi:hypothetical protein